VLDEKNMKTKIQTLAVLLFTFFFLFSSFAYKNEPDGFRHIEWGSKFSGSKGMVLKQNNGYDRVYTKENEHLIWNGISVDYIEYHFLQDDRFYGVELEKRGITFEDSEEIKEKLIDNYENPAKKEGYFDVYVWENQYNPSFSHSGTKITFFYNNETKNVRIKLYWHSNTHML